MSKVTPIYGTNSYVILFKVKLVHSWPKYKFCKQIHEELISVNQKFQSQWNVVDFHQSKAGN